MKLNWQRGGRQGVFLGCYVILAGSAQADDAELRQFFLGKQVTVKIDMPATPKGIDLHFDKGEPMNWSEYSDRLKQYGVALRRGEQVTVTNIVSKKRLSSFNSMAAASAPSATTVPRQKQPPRFPRPGPKRDWRRK